MGSEYPFGVGLLLTRLLAMTSCQLTYNAIFMTLLLTLDHANIAVMVCSRIMVTVTYANDHVK